MSGKSVESLLEQILLRKVAAQAEPNPQKREAEAQGIFTNLMFLVADLMGPELLSDVYGSVKGENIEDTLRVVAQRAIMAGTVFSRMPTDRGSLDEVAREAMAVRGGDAPLLFARLPGRKAAHRVLREKLQAHLWDAYLDGLGVSLVERRAELSKTFGQPWDTISRWLKHAIEALGTEHVDFLMNVAKTDGKNGRPFFDSSARFTDRPLAGESWQTSLLRVRERFQALRKANLGNV